MTIDSESCAIEYIMDRAENYLFVLNYNEYLKSILPSDLIERINTDLNSVTKYCQAAKVRKQKNKIQEDKLNTK